MDQFSFTESLRAIAPIGLDTPDVGTTPAQRVDQLGRLLDSLERQSREQDASRAELRLFAQASVDSWTSAEREAGRWREQADEATRWRSSSLQRLLRVVDAIDALRATADQTNNELLRDRSARLLTDVLRIFAEVGVTQIEATVGSTRYDERWHEGEELRPTKNQREHRMVAEVIERGFLFKGELLRHAKVVVFNAEGAK